VRVYDDLYGLIDFTDDERKVIQHPYFQRLRRIGQLALAHYVFPGATHSRFSHSLGVAHLAGEAARRLHLPKDEESLLRISALLLDLGHFPLSHSLEGVYNAELSRHRREADLSLESDSLMDSSLIKHLLAGEKDAASHEVLSSYLVKYSSIASEIKKCGVDPRDVAKLIRGNHESIHLNQMIHSDIDVDTMDYLRRDAKATGINYGEFSLPYLLGNLSLEPVDNDKKLLCVNRKALHTAEHFVLAKYFYYLQILFHKKRLIYDYIAQIIARWLLERGLLPDLMKLQQWIRSGDFSRFDDQFFIQRIQDWLREGGEKAPSDVQRRLCSVLLNREIVKEKLDREYLVEYESTLNDLIQFEIVKRRTLEQSKERFERDALDYIKENGFADRNLLAHKEIRAAIAGDHPHFPLVIERSFIYPTDRDTYLKARYQSPELNPLLERETIKVLDLQTRDRNIKNINELPNSMVRWLSGRTVFLVRYYSIDMDG